MLGVIEYFTMLLELIGISTIRSHTSSYWRFILTMALHCIIADIKRYIGRNLDFFIRPAFDSPFRGPRRNSAITLGVEKQERCHYPMVKKV